MFSIATLGMLAGLLSSVAALSGQASTTRYFDGQKGACGCGSGSSNFGWQTGISPGVYTAAASQAIFDEGGKSWCGAGCGQCFQLTSTGSAPAGQGAGGDAGKSIIVMVTNLCPNQGNEEWCPNPGQHNQFGYEYHFDIMASGPDLQPIIGDNPVVNFESVACPGSASGDFGQCQCA